jgi:hypothetical protein
MKITKLIIQIELRMAPLILITLSNRNQRQQRITDYWNGERTDIIIKVEEIQYGKV